ncbi:hypothetical protein A0H81_12569 [Grifola frondosa]|uniref:Uncharacterized protein n=1 Tax=Grifola frondosa TaxID=5627 RepID=A0A1C7LRC2_GRIFR|nr:hypothetical protein A0H81_12569 [Grifola frondosa]
MSKDLSTELSKKFGRQPEYYLRLMFSNGSKLQASRKPNAFNAWVHHKAKEVNENDYHKLSEVEKLAYVKELEEERDLCGASVRLTQRRRKQDVKKVCEQVEDMLTALGNRVGIEFFYGVVRNMPDYQMEPRWFCSNPELEKYLRGAVRKGFDPKKICALAEAFSVAGCDWAAFMRTSKSKAEHMKAEIRDKINVMLVDITNNEHAVMKYTSFERDIVMQHRIDLVGWTADKFCNLSDLSNSLPQLEKLLEALESGACRFV